MDDLMLRGLIISDDYRKNRVPGLYLRKVLPCRLNSLHTWKAPYFRYYTLTPGAFQVLNHSLKDTHTAWRYTKAELHFRKSCIYITRCDGQHRSG